MNRTTHWDSVYSSKGERDVSWFESVPTISLQMIEAVGVTPDTCVVDIGGGDSRLVDALLARGLDCIAVLDVSETALRRAQTRLDSLGDVVTWIRADVTSVWSLKPIDIWHDRAVFHFLITPTDRERYRCQLLQTLKPGGSAIIATFALDGPERCSGLPVQRYSPESLASELGGAFNLVEAVPYTHTTPWGTRQSFQYCRFSRLQTAASANSPQS